MGRSREKEISQATRRGWSQLSPDVDSLLLSPLSNHFFRPHCQLQNAIRGSFQAFIFGPDISQDLSDSPGSSNFSIHDRLQELNRFFIGSELRSIGISTHNSPH